MTDGFFEELRIKDTTPEGYGVASADGKIIFVKGAVEGDICSARTAEEKKNYSFAEMTSLSVPSVYREEPECSAFGTCGGCSLCHVSYEYEKEIKKRFVSSSLSKFGLKDIKVNDLLGENIQGYRNKAVFHLKNGKAGFYREESNDIFPLPDECMLLPAEFCRIAAASAEYLKDKEGTDLTLKISSSGEILACLSGLSEKDEAEKISKYIMSDFPSVSGFAFSNGPAKPPYKQFYSHCTVSEISDMKFRITHSGFFQVNYAGMEHILGEIRRMTENIRLSSCLDLYCGSGTLGLSLAKHHPEMQLTGVEINPVSIENAKANAEMNRVNNTRFICRDASDFRAFETYDLVMVDPPRSGLSKKSTEIVKKCAEKYVIYVSCNPQTLARDLVSLTNDGFEIKEATPINMFPRTAHVETVCLLSKLSKAKHHVEVELDMDKMNLASAESKATYDEIRKYVKEKTGLQVSNLNIAQVKRECGIIERENYNKAKSGYSTQPKCPEEKRKAIMEALKHFGMVFVITH